MSPYREKRLLILLEPNFFTSRAIILGAAKFISTQGHWSICHISDHLKACMKTIEEWKPDGIIASSGYRDMPKIAACGIPMYVINGPGPEGRLTESHIGYCDCDEDAIGHLAAKYFLSNGFEHFGYFEYSSEYCFRQRGQSFCDQILQAGFQTHPYREKRLPVSAMMNQQIDNLISWVESLPKPIAIFSCFDTPCWHISRACESLNLKIPNEVALLGVDNDEIVCNLCRPPLSSVSVDYERCGFEIMKMLDSAAQQKKPKLAKIVINAKQVVVRLSTNKILVGGDDVRSALDYIQEHANNMLQVEEVADAVGVSKRVLQQHFRELLGWTIHDEIKDAVMKKVIYYLVTTNQSISEIAFHVGYSDSSHLSRSFTKAKGMSPLQYRKKYGHP